MVDNIIAAGDVGGGVAGPLIGAGEAVAKADV